MLKKMVIILIIILSFPIKTFAIETINIEIFSVDKASIVKNTSSNSNIENQVRNYLKNVTGIYAKLNPVPNSGYMIKVPLESPFEIKNQWTNSFVDEVVIIFPKDESPYLLIFDNKDNPIFFTFKGDIDIFLKDLTFELNLDVSLTTKSFG